MNTTNLVACLLKITEDGLDWSSKFVKLKSELLLNTFTQDMENFINLCTEVDDKVAIQLSFKNAEASITAWIGGLTRGSLYAQSAATELRNFKQAFNSDRCIFIKLFKVEPIAD